MADAARGTLGTLAAARVPLATPPPPHRRRRTAAAPPPPPHRHRRRTATAAAPPPPHRHRRNANTTRKINGRSRLTVPWLPVSTPTPPEGASGGLQRPPRATPSQPQRLTPASP